MSELRKNTKESLKMNCAFVLLFAMLVSNSRVKDVIAKIVTNDDNVQLEENNIQRDGKIRTNFMSLDSDVLYQIMDLSELEAVVNLCEAIPQLYSVGASVYQKNYREFEVKISCAKPVKIPGRDFKIDVNPPSLHLASYETILNIIKRFGSAMQRIYIQHNLINSIDAARNIIQHIINYTSESLVHLNLGVITPETFLQLPVPFKNIESVAFAMYDGNKTELPTLNQLFPNLKHLELRSMENANSLYDFIDVELPHLEHLHVIGACSKIESLIRKNPQIRDIGIENFPQSYFKVIKELLPNVERLTLKDYFTDEVGVVQFANVNHFCYIIPNSRGLSAESIGKLSFPLLESLEIKRDFVHHHFERQNIAEGFEQFFINHVNISKLHYVDRLSNCNQLMDLTAALPNLTEMTVECSDGTDHLKILNFIRNHEKLVKFQVTSAFGDANLFNIRSFIPKEWQRNEFSGEWEGYSFERKN